MPHLHLILHKHSTATTTGSAWLRKPSSSPPHCGECYHRDSGWTHHKASHSSILSTVVIMKESTTSKTSHYVRKNNKSLISSFQCSLTFHQKMVYKRTPPWHVLTKSAQNNLTSADHRGDLAAMRPVRQRLDQGWVGRRWVMVVVEGAHNSVSGSSARPPTN